MHSLLGASQFCFKSAVPEQRVFENSLFWDSTVKKMLFAKMRCSPGYYGFLRYFFIIKYQKSGFTPYPYGSRRGVHRPTSRDYALKNVFSIADRTIYYSHNLERSRFYLKNTGVVKLDRPFTPADSTAPISCDNLLK
jgi:hypothetical protein